MDHKTLSILNSAGQLHSFRHQFDPRRVLGVPSFAMAFNDEPPGEGDTPPGANDDPPLTQADVDRIVEARLAREREAQRKRVEGLGFSGWDELEAAHKERREAEAKAKADAEAAERDRLEKAREWEKLRELDRQKAEEARVQLERERDEANARATQLEEQARTSRISSAVLTAATVAGANHPEQVAALIGSRFGELEGAVVVLDEFGKPRTDGKGAVLTATAFVGEWLEQNPHFQKPAGGRGAGSTGGSGSAHGAGLDIARVKAGDINYIRENKDKIEAARAAGQLG